MSLPGKLRMTVARLATVAVLVSGTFWAGGALLPATAAAAGSSTTSAASNLNNFSVGSSTSSSSQDADTTPVSSSSSSSGGDSISTGSAILVGVIAAGLLVWIGFFITRDARRQNRARTHHKQTTNANQPRRSGSKPPHKSRKLKPAERKRRQRGRSR